MGTWLPLWKRLLSPARRAKRKMRIRRPGAHAHGLRSSRPLRGLRPDSTPGLRCARIRSRSGESAAPPTEVGGFHPRKNSTDPPFENLERWGTPRGDSLSEVSCVGVACGFDLAKSKTPRAPGRGAATRVVLIYAWFGSLDRTKRCRGRYPWIRRQGCTTAELRLP